LRSPVLLWSLGIVISLAVAIIPPWVDPKYIYIQVAILIGLMAICIGFLIQNALKYDEQSAALEKRMQADAGVLEKRMQADADMIAQVLKELSPIANASPACKDFVTKVVKNWAAIERRGEVAVFSDIHRDIVQGALGSLMDLASGVITVGMDGPYSVRLRRFDDVLSYRAVSIGPLEFWMTNFGKNYLETHRKSIQDGGLEVERIFILDDSQLDVAEPILRTQVASGIQVWVVRRTSVSDIHRAHIIDQGVVEFRDNQKLLMRPLATRYQEQADRERLSVIPGEILAAEHSLNVLRSNAVELQADTAWPF
jgi:hypothetical protein